GHAAGHAERPENFVAQKLSEPDPGNFGHHQAEQHISGVAVAELGAGSKIGLAPRHDEISDVAIPQWVDLAGRNQVLEIPEAGRMSQQLTQGGLLASSAPARKKARQRIVEPQLSALRQNQNAHGGKRLGQGGEAKVGLDGAGGGFDHCGQAKCLRARDGALFGHQQGCARLRAGKPRHLIVMDRVALCHSAAKTTERDARAKEAFAFGLKLATRACERHTVGMKHVCATAALFLAALSCQAVGFLHARGQDIVDEQGNRVMLRGVGLGNWMLPEGYMWRFGGGADRPRRIEKVVSDLIGPKEAAMFWREYRSNYVTDRDIARIAALGFNSVRPALDARLFLTEGDSPRDVQEGYDLLDNLV